MVRLTKNCGKWLKILKGTPGGLGVILYTDAFVCLNIWHSIVLLAF